MNGYRLADISPFSVLPEAEIESLQKSLPIVEFQAGETIFHEGHSDDKLFILLEGRVEIVKSLGNDDERLLGNRGAGTFLGEMSLFNRDGCHTASVRSITPITLLKISHSDLDSLLHRQPQLAYEIIRMFSNRLETSENITILELKEKNQRLQQAYDELAAAQEQIIEKEKLEKEIEIAAQIQRSILPETLPEIPGYEFGALMHPARTIGGDFYAFFELEHNRLGIAVGDVCGKGVPAALFMGLSLSLVRAEAIRTDSPVKTINNVNSQLLQMNAEGMFITLVYGILDLIDGSFHFVRAGHTSPLVQNQKGDLYNLPVKPGQPLGIFEDILIDEQHVRVPTGGLILLYSDGVTEPENSAGIEFGMNSLHRSMGVSMGMGAQGICEKLWGDLTDYSQGIPQQDDFTVVAIKRMDA